MVGRLVFLIDTNIWLELLLEQERANEVRDFFARVNSAKLYITDFTIYSIGIILLKLQKIDALKLFITKTIIESDINKIVLEEKELLTMLSDNECEKLDFDDCYQYYAAKKSGTKIISFDNDFDKTELGRKTPGEVETN